MKTEITPTDIINDTTDIEDDEDYPLEVEVDLTPLFAMLRTLDEIPATMKNMTRHRLFTFKQFLVLNSS